MILEEGETKAAIWLGKPSSGTHANGDNTLSSGHGDGKHNPNPTCTPHPAKLYLLMQYTCGDLLCRGLLRVRLDVGL